MLIDRNLYIFSLDLVYVDYDFYIYVVYLYFVVWWFNYVRDIVFIYVINIWWFNKIMLWLGFILYDILCLVGDLRSV